MIDRATVLLALAVCACGGKGEETPSASGAPAGSGGKSAAASSASASSQAAASSAGATSASGALTKEAFCERAVKLGEARLAKCSKDDENQRTYLDFKPSVESAKGDCEARVLSAQVEFHADVGAACLAVAEKLGGPTTFATFSEIPACRGVVSGKVTEGQSAQVVEECAAGLSLRGGKCLAPAAANAACAEGARGVVAKTEDHPGCQAGLVCRAIGNTEDGMIPPSSCVPAAIGARCDPAVGNCPDGANCYQGKCRENGALGAECMHDGHCQFGLMCDIPGGLFGKCAEPKPVGEKCREHAGCASGHCRAGKCTAFCGG